MEVTTSGLPKQKIPKSKKTEQWYKQCTDHFITEASFNSVGRTHIQKLYELANNELHESLYRYVTNPYNSAKSKNFNFPAKIRHYPIIRPVLDLLMGEKAKRPFNYTVVSKNEDSVSKAYEEEYNKVLEIYKSAFLNEYNAQIQSGVPPEEIQDPEEVLEKLRMGPVDARAITGQNALEYILENYEIFDKAQTLFYDYLVAGACFTYKDVIRDDIHYEIVSPLDIEFHKTPDNEYVEDGDWVVRRKIMSVNEVLDRFYDVLTDDEIDQLENPSEVREGGFFTPFFERPEYLDERKYDNRIVEVLHVVWKGWKKIGILTYIDENGFPEQMEVDEDYIVDKDLGESVEWIWVNEIYETYKIDGKLYKESNPIAVQRNEINNLSKCKLPYNGRLFSNRHSVNKSIVEVGLPFQVLYNILHYRFETTMAKAKDKIILMDINAIPKSHGWSEEKFMYYADAMGFAFIDTAQEGANKGFNQYTVLDAQLGQYANQMLNLMAQVKQEWEEVVGITRQRKGEVSASDSVGGTQEAIFRSSIITEEIFRKFEKFIEKDLSGLLDYSKFAWLSGKKSIYLKSDLRSAILDINPEDYLESEFALFVRGGGKEQEKLNMLKQFAQAFAQNGSTPSTVAEVINSENFAKIRNILKEAEAAQQKMNEQMQQQQAEMEQQAIAMQLDAKQRDNEHELEVQARQHQHEKEVVVLKEGAKAMSDLDNDGEPDAATIYNALTEQARLDLERRKNEAEIISQREELRLKEKELELKNEMNKRDNDTALKNKVSGEK
jgi:hypothetical protein